MLKVKELGNEIPALAGVGRRARAATPEPQRMSAGPPGQQRWLPQQRERSRMALSRVGVRDGAELCQCVPIPVPVPTSLSLPHPACPRGCPWHPSLGQQSFPSPSLRRDPIRPRAEAVGDTGLGPRLPGPAAQTGAGEPRVSQGGGPAASLGNPAHVQGPPEPRSLQPAPSLPGGTRSGWRLPWGSGCQRQKLSSPRLHRISLDFLW